MANKDESCKKRIQALKVALLEFLGINGRHYGDMNRLEQSIEDLAQALNTRLDQRLIKLEKGGDEADTIQVPRERLATRFMETATKLARGGRVDEEMADQFEQAIDMFDIAADLKRQAATTQDAAESAVIKHKRGK